jgi:hypothetical protein
LFPLQKIIVSVCVIFLSAKGYSGDPFQLITGAKQTGMAKVCVMNSDFWSSFHNQAGLAFNRSCSFGFNYENRFNLKELGIRSAGLIIPAGRASMGVVYSHSGYSNFSRQMVGLASGMTLSDLISAGVQIDYFSEKTISEYNNNQSVTVEAGIIITPSEDINIGIQIFNPVPNSFRKTDMPTRLRAGAGIRLSKELFAGVETEMDSGHKPVIRTGFEYEASKKFMVRGGFSTGNSSFCFGVGYLAGPAKIDLGFSTHERLGITSSVSVIFEMTSLNPKVR